MALLGIDFGTAYVRVVAVPSDGEPRAADVVVAPAIVAFGDGTVAAGDPVLMTAGAGKDIAVSGIKRLLGRDADEPAVKAAAERRGLRATVEDDDLVLTPEQGPAGTDTSLRLIQGAAETLRYAVEQATGKRGKHEAVIAVPSWFSEPQRRALAKAAQAAQIKVLRYIRDTVATAQWLLLSHGERGKMAVVDVGAGGMSGSLATATEPTLRIVQSRGDATVGGDDVDAELVGAATMTGDPQSWEQRRQACEAIKRALGDQERVERELTLAGKTRTISVERWELDLLMSGLVAMVRNQCGELLDQAGWRPADLDRVVATGGMTLMPSVAKQIETSLGRQPEAAPEGLNVVALGAALQAAIATLQAEGVELIDGEKPPREEVSAPGKTAGRGPALSGQVTTSRRQPVRYRPAVTHSRRPPGRSSGRASQPPGSAASPSQPPLSPSPPPAAIVVESAAPAESGTAAGTSRPPGESGAPPESTSAPPSEATPPPEPASTAPNGSAAPSEAPSAPPSTSSPPPSAAAGPSSTPPTAASSPVPPEASPAPPPAASGEPPDSTAPDHSAPPEDSTAPPDAERSDTGGSDNRDPEADRARRMAAAARFTSVPPGPGSTRPAEGQRKAAPRPTRGKIVAPRTARDVLGMAVSRPMTARDLNPVYLPVLFRRILGRRDTQGSVTITAPDYTVEFALSGGNAALDKAQHNKLLQAFDLPAAEWKLGEAGHIDRNSEFHPMARVALTGIRRLLRALRADELEEGFGAQLDLAPQVRPDRLALPRRLGLGRRELGFLDRYVDGATPAREAAHEGGLGPSTSLQLLALLDLYAVLDWEQPASDGTAGDEAAGVDLAALASKLGRANHFEVLQVHWSTTDRELEERFEARLAEFGADSPAGRRAPDPCTKIRARIEQAYQVLQDPARRVAYRNVVYGDIDFEAARDLAATRSAALAMRGDAIEARKDELAAKELSRSIPARGDRRPSTRPRSEGPSQAVDDEES